MTEPTGVVVLWACLCSVGADELGDVPETCPGHNRRQVAHHHNTRPGGVAHVHDCPDDYPCPPRENS